MALPVRIQSAVIFIVFDKSVDRVITWELGGVEDRQSPAIASEIDYVLVNSRSHVALSNEAESPPSPTLRSTR
jgi:hypothetical protein